MIYINNNKGPINQKQLQMDHRESAGNLHTALLCVPCWREQGANVLKDSWVSPNLEEQVSSHRNAHAHSH